MPAGKGEPVDKTATSLERPTEFTPRGWEKLPVSGNFLKKRLRRQRSGRTWRFGIPCGGLGTALKEIRQDLGEQQSKHGGCLRSCKLAKKNCPSFKKSGFARKNSQVPSRVGEEVSAGAASTGWAGFQLILLISPSPLPLFFLFFFSSFFLLLFPFHFLFSSSFPFLFSFFLFFFFFSSFFPFLFLLSFLPFLL